MLAAGHRRVGGGDRHRRSRRARRPAGRLAAVERRLGHRRDLPRHATARSTSECFVTRMRQRAAESDVVIVNHHLLCADAAVRQSAYGEVIPDCHYAVIDEAHQLEDVATQYFGIAVSNYRLDELVRDAERLPSTPASASDERLARCAAQMRARRTTTRARFFGGADAGARRSRGLTPASALRVGAGWFGDVARRRPGAGRRRSTRSNRRCSWRRSARAPRGGSRRRAGDARRAAPPRLRDDLRFLMAADDPTTCISSRSRGRGVFLRAAPIDVSRIVQEVLFDRMRATVLTSATLTVEGSFDYVQRPARRPRRRRVCASRRSSTIARRRCSTCRAACRRRSRRSSATPPRARSSRS